ncbi:hypothetical protein AXF42_Ash007690 [Apostasia shenzhenica]|uniref:Methyltransferase type 12 domain-containing protein n=1 Tax=Apostasia shenzhenica TaxID=1088818 RepID=A0A2I0A667_9ASPA|nr:hypothetical protein AXF42_Ash007690 [Apostasia shenzhenica]
MATDNTLSSQATDVKKIQIYPLSSSSSGRQVSPFWRDKYERDAKKYWDLFYKRHKNKFFKDRHYLDKEWGGYFEEGKELVVFEAGCGAGNTIYPIISTYEGVTVHACDFSPRAIDLVKAHDNFRDDKINAFVCDLSAQDLNDFIPSSSVKIVTMVFVLSAVAPEKMLSVLHNIRKVLMPNGHVLFRDYALGDLAQERFAFKDQQISENFYVRGDGTRAYYFSEEFLTNLFKEGGFFVKDIGICNKLVENRSMDLVMNRRWIQAVFSLHLNNEDGLDGKHEKEHDELSIEAISSLSEPANDSEVDLSDSIFEMFDSEPPYDEVLETKVRGYSFRIKGVSREYQHTYKSTGLMLWESACLMSNVIAENPSIVAGKRILELGCGSAGICSMVSVQFAESIVSTDGDTEALKLLQFNIATNIDMHLIKKMMIKRLIWGKKEDIDAIKGLFCYEGGFDVILGTDVTYNPEAIYPLFTTAKELLLKQCTGKTKPALILCYIERRVCEDSIVSVAFQLGFRLMDRWVSGMIPNDGIICSWSSSGSSYWNDFQNTPLIILYFEL